MKASSIVNLEQLTGIEIWLTQLRFTRSTSQHPWHIDADVLRGIAATTVLGWANANVFNKCYGDQVGQLWSPTGKLLATTHQLTYCKA